MGKPPRYAALALLEFESVAAGISACDRMVKAAPIALLRCGTVHPGRYLALLGGSVASTAEAHRVGTCETTPGPVDAVLLSDVHPALHDAVMGTRIEPRHDALVVVETHSSPALLRALDHAVKGTPIEIGEVRLADDLGGRAMGLLSGDLTNAAEALEIAALGAGEALAATTLLPRLDPNLRQVLALGTRFAASPSFEPEGAEHLEEVACSWDG